MAFALRRYRKALLTTGLISPAELAAFERGMPRAQRPETADGLARVLIEAGKLTQFQVGQIATGRTTGLVLGNYVILDRIGAGGMGQVFKAWHRRMERVVALKTLPDQRSAGEESVARFRREVLSAARLSHPNIVAAYDADVSQGIHFLVMEYVDGPNLSDVLRLQGPLPVVEAVRAVLDAARGLAYAHSQGVIHRDIKPSNLIVDRAGIVKVLDMGLARMPSVAAGAELTLPGDVVGTLEYMAPEQAVGSRDVDARADVYGLGCTLYRLVTGEFPFPGRTPQEIIAAHRNQSIPSLRGFREDVPRSLDSLFKKLVAKDPAERVQSMQEVIAALERLRLVEKRSNRWPARRPENPRDNEQQESDEGIELAPTSAGDLPIAVAAAVSSRSKERTSDKLAKPAAIAPVSPKVAILTLAAALLLIAGLSWLDADRDGSSQSPPGENGSIYQVAQESARQWSESLGVPLHMTNTLGMQFVLIPPPNTDGETTAAFRPFYLSAYELTTAQIQTWSSAAGRSTSAVHGSPADRHPVNVSAADAEMFCRWLSDRERAAYRLPTEAEWTHACLAGAVTPLWLGDDTSGLERFAWFNENAAGRTHQVGLLEANPLGLHDMFGNAAEWCVASSRLPTAFILRGGSYLSPSAELTAVGQPQAPVARGAGGGVRLVLELPAEARWARHDSRP